MLRYKYRMSTHGRLLAVIGNHCRGQSLRNKVFGMVKDGGQAFLLQVMQVFIIELKTGAEPGALQGLKQGIQFAHGVLM